MKKNKKFSHLDEGGAARMVDVGAKPDQVRRAVARGFISMSVATLSLLRRDALPKGDILTVAKIAGIQAAKRTAELIPLCHSLPLNGIELQFKVKRAGVEIESAVTCTGKTGVEMEALTAVSVAALTLYDMAKAVDKGMVIGDIRLVEKTKK